MILTKEQIEARIAMAARRIVEAQNAANACRCPEEKVRCQKRITRLATHMGAHIGRKHLLERDPLYEVRRAVMVARR